MQNKSDLELMQLIRRKHRPALEGLYDRYVNLVYSFAMKTSKNEQTAREIVQLVFTRLWTTEKGYDPAKGQFVNWLLTITRNLSIDLLRKNKRHEQNILIQPEHWEQMPGPTDQLPEEMYTQQMLQDQIRQAYRYLSDVQIQLIEHFYWEGYTLSEVANMYNEPLGTIKSRLHQALKILRKHLHSIREG